MNRRFLWKNELESATFAFKIHGKMDLSWDEIRKILADVAISQKETEQSLKETDRLVRENQLMQKETDRMAKQNQKQLGELGNKLGSFAHGLAFPTVERIMREEFGMTFVGSGIKIRKGADTLEMDVYGYSNGTVNTAIIGEIKSHFRNEDIKQVETACEKLVDFLPEHRGKKVFGIVVFVQADQNAINLAIKRGLYVVQANDDNFRMRSPENFVPKDFGKP